MVWYQYVWEANTGNEAHLSDDENDQDISPLSFEDWELQYNDILRMMWNTTRTLLHDAYITYSGDINDFSRFCYKEHDPRDCFEYHELEPKMMHIWKNIRQIVDANGLHEEMMRGATFWNFMEFSRDTLCVK